ncbi:MAG: hypothetical protein JWR80_8937 [Bradyrhizobium sp.]|nr:hypothetical protein [Bradyrhizobium sp.]
MLIPIWSVVDFQVLDNAAILGLNRPDKRQEQASNVYLQRFRDVLISKAGAKGAARSAAGSTATAGPLSESYEA